MYTFLIISHIIGTALGVGGATFVEIFLLKSLKDGKVDPVEGSFLKVTYVVMRVALVILILSGFGFLLLYRIGGEEELLYSEALWAKMTIILVLVVNTLLLQTRKIPLWLGSSLSLTSWYAALVIGAWHDIPYSFFEILIGYVVIVLIMAGILEFIRKMYNRPDRV